MLALREKRRAERVLTTSARKPPLRSARFEAEVALLPFRPRRFGPLCRHIHLNGHYTFHGDGQVIDLDAIVAGLELG
jgi:hypothetical protein